MAKKYRIIQHGNGKYSVQYKDGFLDSWHKSYTYSCDYRDTNVLNGLRKPLSDAERQDEIDGVFETLALAYAKVDRLMEVDISYKEDDLNRKLMKKFKVIDVREV